MAYRTSVDKTSETLRYTLSTKNVLAPDEFELYELANSAGVVTDPKVFKIIVDLLKQKVAPTAIERMLKSMTVQRRKPHLQQEAGETSSASTASLTSSSLTSSGLTSSKGRPSGLRKPSQR